MRASSCCGGMNPQRCEPHSHTCLPWLPPHRWLVKSASDFSPGGGVTRRHTLAHVTESTLAINCRSRCFSSSVIGRSASLSVVSLRVGGGRKTLRNEKAKIASTMGHAVGHPVWGHQRLSHGCIPWIFPALRQRLCLPLPSLHLTPCGMAICVCSPVCVTGSVLGVAGELRWTRHTNPVASWGFL